jgi:hypothetical protein
MSAAFFDPAADAGLLRQEYRESPELAAIADECELAVLRYYTKRRRDRRNTNLSTYWSVGSSYGDYMTQDVASPLAWGPSSKPVVWLYGYMPDPAACEAGLALDIKRTVALVANWRFAQNRISPVESRRSSQDQVHADYRESANDTFPPNWDRYLRQYDARERRF